MIIEKNKDKDFELEVVLHYKNSDGGTGSIIKVKRNKMNERWFDSLFSWVNDHNFDFNSNN